MDRLKLSVESTLCRPEELVAHLNLSTFKTQKCTKKQKHNYKQCPFWHNLKDKRRSLSQYEYSSETCPNIKSKRSCPMKDACQFSHNKVEQAYHVEKYRNKFCVMYPHAVSKCEYGAFCSYAHSEEQVGIELISNYEKDPDFFIFHFKTLFCPYSHDHDRAECVYAHNWQDFRRSPQKHKYTAESCPYWDPKKHVSDYISGCPKAMDCELCHGWKEYEFHPQVYKKQRCSFGNCRKGFFCSMSHENELPLLQYPSEIQDQDLSSFFLLTPKNRTSKSSSGSRVNSAASIEDISYTGVYKQNPQMTPKLQERAPVKQDRQVQKQILGSFEYCSSSDLNFQEPAKKFTSWDERSYYQQQNQQQNNFQQNYQDDYGHQISPTLSSKHENKRIQGAHGQPNQMYANNYRNQQIFQPQEQHSNTRAHTLTQNQQYYHEPFQRQQQSYQNHQRTDSQQYLQPTRETDQASVSSEEQHPQTRHRLKKGASIYEQSYLSQYEQGNHASATQFGSYHNADQRNVTQRSIHNTSVHQLPDLRSNVTSLTSLSPQKAPIVYNQRHDMSNQSSFNSNYVSYRNYNKGLETSEMVQKSPQNNPNSLNQIQSRSQFRDLLIQNSSTNKVVTQSTMDDLLTPKSSKNQPVTFISQISSKKGDHIRNQKIPYAGSMVEIDEEPSNSKSSSGENKKESDEEKDSSILLKDKSLLNATRSHQDIPNTKQKDE